MSIFDPGKGDRSAATNAANQSVINNLFSGGAFGGGSFENGNFNADLGQFGGIFSNIMNMLGSSGFGSGGGQNLQQLMGFGQNAMNQLGSGSFALDEDMIERLRQSSMGQLDVLGRSAQELGADQLDIMRQIAAPEEQRARVGLQDNLFGQGRMGTTGGAQNQEALYTAQARADLERQLAANEYGRGVRSDAMNQLYGNLGQVRGMTNDAAARVLDRFGIAGNIFDSQRATAQDPLAFLSAGLGGLGQIQGYGLNNFNMGLQSALARSNSLLGSAGIHQQNAAMATSPLLDLASGVLGAAGSAGGFGALFSDERLKDNVKFVSEDGRGNRWYTWTWNAQAKLLGITQPTFGVIAQEVRKYNPSAVSEGPQGFLTVNYGAL